MNRKTLTVFACLGWGLFALSLFSPAPADEKDGGGAPLTPNCPADLAPGAGDGNVGVPDLLFIINNWGPCPAGCQTAGDCNDANPCTTDICMAGNCQNIPIDGCCQFDGDCPTVPNSISLCQGNQCVLICNVGYVDCDGLYANGCEVNVFNDPQNCSACNVVCPQYPNAIATCTNGICGWVCSPGYADCDQDIFTNGCEVWIDGTPQHCGGCNVVCPPGWSCINGNCTPP